jgi:hypothetical protein
LVSEALALWQNALGRVLPFTPNVVVCTLSPGVLGETYVTSWNAAGGATDGTILISPNAAGAGWYDDPATGGKSVFTQPLANNAFAAQPGSAAVGQYDLLAALLHEIGHIEGFLPSSSSFESHVQTTGGSQVFVGPGVSASLVDADQELNPSAYANDLMSATLATGVRELPSALDVQIVDIVNGISAPSPVTSTLSRSASTTSSAVAPTTLVDHAVAALGSTDLAGKRKHSRPAKKAVTGKKAAHQNGHSVTIKIAHSGENHEQNGSIHRVVTKAHAKVAKGKAKVSPDGSQAVHLSRRGAIAKGHFH